MGRPRKPTELKILEGTFRKDRDGSRVLFAATPFPAPPAHLTTGQRRLWTQLETYCASWVGESDWMALTGAVSLFDLLLQVQAAQQPLNPDGAGAAEHPLIGTEVKLWKELRGYLAILGLSPADRARVHSKEPSGKPSKWAGVLTGRRPRS